MKLNLKLALWGITSFLGLILFNFLFISFLSKSTNFALEQLLNLKLYIIPLALGFSFQVLLFLNIREKVKGSSGLVFGSGTMSTGSMIACCAHHITEVLPFLALGGISIFFTNYQKELLIFSILINWLGVLYFFSQGRKKYSKSPA